MQVAYICADAGVSVFGCKAASIRTQEMIRALLRRGVHVTLFATRLGGGVPAGLEGVPIHVLPPIPGGNPAARERVALAANAGLRAALEREGPFDLIYERYSLWSFTGMEYARSMGVPGFLEVNAHLIEEQARCHNLTDRAGAEWVAERVFSTATALLAASDEVAAYLEDHSAAQGRVHVVSDGVDPDRLHPGLMPALPGCPGIFTVGFADSLSPRHGVDVLLDAFSMLRQREHGVRLLLVGDRPERDRLVADLAACGVADSVHLAGSVAPDDVPAWLASMDVAVVPYLDLDGCSFSLLKVYEYMAAGIPVVVSQVGQLADLIEDGVNGVHVPPGDAVALANALAWLRTNSGLRARLGPAGRATVLRNHTWDAVAERILALAGFPHRSGLPPDQERRPAQRLHTALSAVPAGFRLTTRQRLGGH